MITLERLAEIEAKVNAATEGPWFLCDVDGADFTVISTQSNSSELEHEVLGVSEWLRAEPEDLLLMAHARTDIPDLIAQVKRLREALQIYSETHVWVLATAMVKNGDKGLKLWEKLGKDAIEALNPKEQG